MIDYQYIILAFCMQKANGASLVKLSVLGVFEASLFCTKALSHQASLRYFCNIVIVIVSYENQSITYFIPFISSCFD